MAVFQLKALGIYVCALVAASGFLPADHPEGIAPHKTVIPTVTPAPTVPPTPVPTRNPNADSIAAMRPAFASDIAAFSDLPQYELALELIPSQRLITGTETITFTNRSNAPLDDIAVRLYPNFPKDVFGKGGDVQMEVLGAQLGDQPLDRHYAAERTAVLLNLPQPLQPGATTTFTIVFSATIQPWHDGSWPLPAYYPMLAVRDQSGWRLDVTRFADHVYAESAFYRASIRLPKALQLVTTGSTLTRHEQEDGTAVYEVRTGPVREFAMTAGEFVMSSQSAGSAGDVTVNVYRARSTKISTAQIAQVAATALNNFDQRFGPYPYRELDIQLLPYQFDGGDEYPGLIMLYSNGGVDAGLRYVTAHEVAHQWWYAVVGNDIYQQPWLDEALAQYSGIIYAEDVAGASVANADWNREVQRRYRGALTDGDLPVGLSITDYPNFNVYYRTVYGKGPVFLRTLRKQLGDEVFFKGLQRYYQQNRYGVGTTEAIKQAFEQASGQNLDALFAQWVTGDRS